MIVHSIFFYTFSIIAIISAIMVVVSKNTVHSVFFLILDFISISCLFIMIGAEFLGMIMLIVYVGAVAVLFLFVVMMLNVAQQKNQWFSSKKSSSHIPVGLIISLIIFFELIIVIGGWKNKPELNNGYFNTGDVGYIKDNQLFVTGRRKDIFKKGSEIISPQEIKNVCLKSKLIKDCCVIEKSDLNKGAKIYILVEFSNFKDPILNINKLNKFLI